MSQQNETGIKTFTAGEALAAYRRVKLSAASGSQVEYADAKEPAIGITVDAAASGASVGVKLFGASNGTFKMTASAAITVGDVVFGTADGKIDNPAGAGLVGVPVGIALEAATANGDIIEVLPMTIRVVAGQHTTVAAADTVVTGLTKVFGVVAQLDSDPVDGAMHVTASIGDQNGAPAAGSILINSWKSTDADATLIAGTTFSKLVNYVAFGI